MVLDTILTIHGYVLALIFLITVYFWVECKNRGIIDLYRRPITVGLILGLGLPLLLGSLHFFLSSTVSLIVKYGLFFVVSLSLFIFNLANYSSNKRKVVGESKEFMNLRKRPLVKELPITKQKIKEQLMRHFIKPELEKLESIKRENTREHNKSMQRIQTGEGKIKDKLEDLQEKEEEIDKKVENLKGKEDYVRKEKLEVKFHLEEIKKELTHVKLSRDDTEKEKDKLEFKRLRTDKYSDKIKKKLQDLMMFEEELEKEKSEFKKARKQADSILKLKKKIDGKIKEYNSKLKVFIVERHKLEKDKRALEARHERLDDEWDDIKDDKAWVEKQKYKVKREYQKLNEKKRKLQLFEDKIADRKDDLELEKGKLENLRSSLRKVENELESVRSKSSLKEEEVKALKEKLKRK